MKRVNRFLAWGILILILIGGHFAALQLPFSARKLTAEKYSGWSGVIRVWICEGFEVGNGSLIPWLNSAAERFERSNRGVYFQFKTVSAEAIARYAKDAELQPDMILFAPGMAAADTLLDIEGTVRTDLLRAGQQSGVQKAIPVALGGYALLEDPDLSASAAVPKDEPYRSFSAALISVLADGAPISEVSRSSSSYKDFTGKKASSLLATQRDVRRLRILEDSGKAPDWEVTVAANFTDQIALAGIVDTNRENERVALCQNFVIFLTSDAVQSQLTKVRAFRVDGGDALYEGQPGFAELEAALSGELYVPGAFRNDWRKEAEMLVELVLSGRLAKDAALSRLLESL